MSHSIICKLKRNSYAMTEPAHAHANFTSTYYRHAHLATLGITLLACTLSITSSFAEGNASAGKTAWSRTCERCHGSPTPRSKAAFSDYGMTANKLSVYANDPAAITKAANEGYIVPEGNTNDKVPVGRNTNEEMRAFAGMAPDRLGYGTTPTQYAIDISAYFASLFEAPLTPSVTSTPPAHQVAAMAAPIPDKVVPNVSPKNISLSPPATNIAVTVAKAPVATNSAPPSFDQNSPTILRARAGDRQAKIYFNVPVAVASTITDFTVIAVSNGIATGISAKGTKSPITVSGLNNGSDYTFTVLANCNDGKSLRSAPSDQITPLAILAD